MINSPAKNGQHVEESSTTMGENVANLACDLVTLAELQTKLVILDIGDSAEQAKTPAMMFAGASCVLLGTTPVLLLALGGLLADWAQFPVPAGWLIVGLLALAGSCLCLWLAFNRLKAASQVLLRSRNEFQENVAWMKKVIQQTSASNH